MARTPSLSPGDAEALLGPRGVLRVDANNRGLVKKWLVASGLPAQFVAGLSYVELGLAYNKTDGSGLAQLREKLARGRSDMGEDWSDDDASPMPTPDQLMGKDGGVWHDQHTAPRVNGSGDVGQQLAELIGRIGCDPAQVKAIAESVLRSRFDQHADKLQEQIRVALEAMPPRHLVVEYKQQKVDLGDAPRHPRFETLLTVVGQNVPAMLVGPAGSGKTIAAEMVAQALSLPFLMQGAATGAHEYLGYCDAQGRYQTTPWRQAYEHGGVFLCDEIDASDPAVMLVINAGIANGHMAFPDRPELVKRHADFRLIAAANTFGRGADRQYVGRNQLDAATIDRFGFLLWDYDEKLERALVPNESWVGRVQAVRSAVAAEKARLIVSLRASINGARLLATGMPQGEVEDMVIWKGLDSELQRKILARV